MLRSLVVALAVAVGSLSLVETVDAQTARGNREARAKANEWTVGLAAGLPEDSLLPFAAEISRNLNEGGTLRVLPLATPGAANNVRDLLYLDGMDVALTQTDVLYHLRTVEKIPQVEKRVQLIAALSMTDVHLLVRPEIRSVQDLAGKKVGFNVNGAGPTITAPIIFERLNVQVEPVYVSQPQALSMMRSGELAGLVHSAAKPNTLIASVGADTGFKLLPIPLDKLGELYAPSQLTSADYPNLIKGGQKVETVAVQTVLATLDRQQADRTRRVRRFIEQFYDRFDRFRGLGYQQAWKEVSLSADVAGWTRHELAGEMIKQQVTKAREAARKAGFMDPAEQEKLFQRFLDVTRQAKR